jgi:2,3-bisphosphoglycerate-dependent phosphoglycerate mutase
MKKNSAHFDVVYTSLLSRAIKSTNYIMDLLDIHYVPVIKDWRLN